MKWFLIKQNEHYGPFSEEQIHSFYERKKIRKTSKVWTEGWDKERTYEEAFLTEEIEEEILPPGLPPEVMKTEEVKKDVIKDKPIIVKESFTEIPVKHLGEDTDEVEEVEESIFEEEFDDQSATKLWENANFEVEDENLEQRSKLPTAFLVICVFIILGSASWYYYHFQDRLFSRPGNMSYGHFEKLAQFTKIKTPPNSFMFLLSKDKKNIWMATNNPLEGKIDFDFKSIKDQTLGGRTHIKGTGYLKDHLIKVEELEFLEGNFIVDGYYQIDLKSQGPLQQNLYQMYFSKEPKEINYTSTKLISSLKKELFEKALSKMMKKKNDNSSEFTKELIEKYKTIKTITAQIHKAVSDVFEGDMSEWKIRVNKFEKDYKKNFGIFFTRFVIANEDSYKSLVRMKFKNKSKVIANYSKLSTIARAIGIESMGILEDLESAPREEASIEALKQKSLGRLEKIMIECENKLKEIKGES